jgi:hypothetical protein
MATAALKKDIRIMRTPEDSSKLSHQVFCGPNPSAEGDLMLRLDMLIAKNQDLLLHEDIDNLIEKLFVQLF